ncbi:hypothetical protein CN367_11875 [Priestia megaterium]|uniref:hypothetical protein n=1 Tax=Priestia megaterium TaxID=1404 RepID=UPI000BF73D9C|nr:hypothetical protein [Priestia megaterium]PEZ47057.1 hypothetical protein CN367_11875 [Priestia megaterium]
MNAELIKQLEEALKLNNDLYNDLGNAEYTLKQAGRVYDQRVGFPTIQALSKVLIHLKEEN